MTGPSIPWDLRFQQPDRAPSWGQSTVAPTGTGSCNKSATRPKKWTPPLILCGAEKQSTCDREGISKLRHLPSLRPRRPRRRVKVRNTSPVTLAGGDSPRGSCPTTRIGFDIEERTGASEGSRPNNCEFFFFYLNFIICPYAFTWLKEWDPILDHFNFVCLNAKMSG